MFRRHRVTIWRASRNAAHPQRFYFWGEAQARLLFDGLTAGEGPDPDIFQIILRGPGYSSTYRKKYD